VDADRLRDVRILAVLVALGTVWGSAFVSMKVLSTQMTAIEVAHSRLMLGGALVLALVIWQRLPVDLSPRNIVATAVAATFDMLLPFTIIAWAGGRIDSGLGAVLLSTMPLFTTIFAPVFLPEERLSAARVAGVTLGFAGVVAVTQGKVLDVTNGDALGMLAVVAGACAYSIGGIYGRFQLRRQHPLSFTGLKLVLGSLICLPLLAASGGTRAYSGLDGEGVAAILSLGLLATGAAYSAFFWLVSNAGTVKASLAVYVIPVSGLTLSWAILGEPFGIATVAGAALIIGGVATGTFGGSMKVPAFVRRVRIPATWGAGTPALCVDGECA
jgi:drug/metabolite transporter (DMT)-like permease